MQRLFFPWSTSLLSFLDLSPRLLRTLFWVATWPDVSSRRVRTTLQYRVLRSDKPSRPRKGYIFLSKFASASVVAASVALLCWTRMSAGLPRLLLAVPVVCWEWILWFRLGHWSQTRPMASTCVERQRPTLFWRSVLSCRWLGPLRYA